MSLYTVLGLGACLGGCLSLYLASPHQRLRAAAWPARPARITGALALLGAWFALAQDMQRLTASFTLATLAMLGFALLPYLGALRALRRGSLK